MEADGFDDLLADGEDGIEGGHRLLEDHGDVAAADRLHLFFGELEEVAALEEDLATEDFAGRARG